MRPVASGDTLRGGRYRLDEVIGRGGMALVWRATDTKLERVVAIKIISDVLATDPSFLARFEREARIAAALSHPNLVKVFDFSIEAERPYLVMEYIAGGTLADARGRPLDCEALARALLDALAHIHAAGIIHRDIKPANVLLAPDGTPLLTDFGVARGEEATGLTQTGQVIGTHGYIAPEVLAGRPATVQSDLFALGALLRELDPRAPEPMATLIRRMTAADPADRPRTAGEALAELDPTRALVQPDMTAATAALAADAIREADAAAPAETNRLRVGGFAMRRSQAIAAAVALLVILTIIIVAATSGGGSKLEVKQTTTLQPAPAGAPVDQQLDRLEQIVRATAPQR